MSPTAPRIALISGLSASSAPARLALDQAFEAVHVWDLLDDRLIDDTLERGHVDDALTTRMARLLDHAALGGADAVLITCSLYGFMADDASHRLGLPVLAPDHAMFDAAMALGVARVAMVSGVPAALTDSAARAASRFGSRVQVEQVLAMEAREPSLGGNVADTAKALCRALDNVPRVDAVLLANYSLSPAAGALQALLKGPPVLSGPVASAQLLRSLLM